MLPKITSNKSYTVTINVKCKENEIEALKSNLQTVANELDNNQMQLLATAVKRPLLKSLALSELKKRI